MDERKPDRAILEQAKRRISDCDRKLKQYKATLDAGGDPAVVSEWIRQTQGERNTALAMMRQADAKPRISRDQIVRTINNLGDMAQALHDGSADRKSEVYRSIGLRATFNPEAKKV
jgi:hypothetical protein